MSIGVRLIQELARRPRVQTIATENFLSSLDLSMPMELALENLWQDAALYRWNRETREAIHAGIRAAYGKAEGSGKVVQSEEAR
jgi:hypothetical protein